LGETAEGEVEEEVDADSTVAMNESAIRLTVAILLKGRGFESAEGYVVAHGRSASIKLITLAGLGDDSDGGDIPSKGWLSH